MESGDEKGWLWEGLAVGSQKKPGWWAELGSCFRRVSGSRVAFLPFGASPGATSWSLR